MPTTPAPSSPSSETVTTPVPATTLGPVIALRDVGVVDVITTQEYPEIGSGGVTNSFENTSGIVTVKNIILTKNFPEEMSYTIYDGNGPKNEYGDPVDVVTGATGVTTNTDGNAIVEINESIKAVAEPTDNSGDMNIVVQLRDRNYNTITSGEVIVNPAAALTTTPSPTTPPVPVRSALDTIVEGDVPILSIRGEFDTIVEEGVPIQPRVGETLSQQAQDEIADLFSEVIAEALEEGIDEVVQELLETAVSTPPVATPTMVPPIGVTIIPTPPPTTPAPTSPPRVGSTLSQQTQGEIQGLFREALAEPLSQETQGQIESLFRAAGTTTPPVVGLPGVTTTPTPTTTTPIPRLGDDDTGVEGDTGFIPPAITTTTTDMPVLRTPGEEVTPTTTTTTKAPGERATTTTTTTTERPVPSQVSSQEQLVNALKAYSQVEIVSNFEITKTIKVPGTTKITGVNNPVIRTNTTAFSIEESNVTLDGFTITKLGNEQTGRGIIVNKPSTSSGQNPSNITINGMTFNEVGTSSLDKYSSIAVLGYNLAGQATVSNIKITNNIIADSPNTAIDVWEVDGLEIINNTIRDTRSAGNGHLGNGIRGSNIRNVTISENALSNIGRMGIEVTGSNTSNVNVINNNIQQYAVSPQEGFRAGISFAQGVNGGIIANNVINGGNNIWNCGIEGAQNSKNIRITDNAVANVRDGILLSAHSDSFFINGNTLNQIKRYGIQTFQTWNITITNNQITQSEAWRATFYSDSYPEQTRRTTGVGCGIFIQQSNRVNVLNNVINGTYEQKYDDAAIWFASNYPTLNQANKIYYPSTDSGIALQAEMIRYSLGLDSSYNGPYGSPGVPVDTKPIQNLIASNTFNGEGRLFTQNAADVIILGGSAGTTGTTSTGDGSTAINPDGNVNLPGVVVVETGDSEGGNITIINDTGSEINVDEWIDINDDIVSDNDNVTVVTPDGTRPEDGTIETLVGTTPYTGVIEIEVDTDPSINTAPAATTTTLAPTTTPGPGIITIPRITTTTPRPGDPVVVTTQTPDGKIDTVITGYTTTTTTTTTTLIPDIVTTPLIIIEPTPRPGPTTTTTTTTPRPILGWPVTIYPTTPYIPFTTQYPTSTTPFTLVTPPVTPPPRDDPDGSKAGLPGYPTTSTTPPLSNWWWRFRFPGCTNDQALNYEPLADIDDGSCIFPPGIPGCTDPNAKNFNPAAQIDDGSCIYDPGVGPPGGDGGEGTLTPRPDPDGSKAGLPGYPTTSTTPPLSNWWWRFRFPGCTNDQALNYEPLADIDDGSCRFGMIPGCTDPEAENFMVAANVDDGSCRYKKERPWVPPIVFKPTVTQPPYIPAECREPPIPRVGDSDTGMPGDTDFIPGAEVDEYGETAGGQGGGPEIEKIEKIDEAGDPDIGARHRDEQDANSPVLRIFPAPILGLQVPFYSDFNFNTNITKKVPTPYSFLQATSTTTVIPGPVVGDSTTTTLCPEDDKNCNTLQY